jgi:NAD(P)-dependent dehydrogenase (short-subunit alcohol dehydrogenase family)
MDMGLGGRTAIVTGGSGGIGRGLVLGFAAEGANVVIATRDEAQGRKVADAAADLPGRAAVVRTDVTDWDSVQAMTAAAEDQFGSIDVLVNNAGGTFQPRPFLTKPRQEWQWEIDLNIWGVIHCTRAVAPAMIERGSGSIVNITSNSALLGEAAAQVENYGGTKGYVMSLSKALAWEWGPAGVRINCIAPGWIVPHAREHAGEGSFWQKFGFEFFGTPDEMAKQAEAGTLPSVQGQPIRRIGRPEDIADLAVFLASDRAGHLTGQLISVSGGAYMP